MIRPLVCVLTGLLLLPLPIQGQASFDPQQYQQFLSSHQNLEPSSLHAMYPAGNFRETIASSVAGPAYFAVLDSIYQLTEYERSLLLKHNFVVSSRLQRATFAQALSEIFYDDLPVFVSTDALLYAVHLSYDNILRDLELSILIPKVTALIRKLHEHLPVLSSHYGGTAAMLPSLRDLDLHLTLPLQLLGESATLCFPENAGMLDTLHRGITELQPRAIRLFGTTPRSYDFSQFIVRGHYARNPRLAQYFHAMIWLGRTEFYLQAPEGTIPPVPLVDVQRQCIDAMLLREAIHATNTVDELAEIDELLRFLLGESDNVTVAQMDDLAARLELSDATELLDTTRMRELQDTLAVQPYAGQRIVSQILMKNPLFPERVKPASAFLLLGQRFIIDGYITGNVVYDKVIYHGDEIKRMLPSSLDVLFCLGNNAAAQLLEPELERFHYATNLAGLRYLVDSYDEAFWSSSLFNAWLGMIRELNPPLDRTTLPEFMQTAAWWQQKMTTQLASWAQLRHDNILYGKQPYTIGIACSFPESYVEPFPLFYDRLGRFARTAIAGLGDIPEFRTYFDHLAGVADTLGLIARKELEGVVLTNSERQFLRTMLPILGGCAPGDFGWYGRILYGQSFDNESADYADYIVADIHTAPTDEFGSIVGWVQHVGTGPVEMALVIATPPGGVPTAFIGPVQSYYEHLASDFTRFTDEEWVVVSQVAPTLRPDWVNLYLADAQGTSRGEGRMLVTDVEHTVMLPLPTSSTLHQNYPNPFNSGTVIPFTLPGGGRDHRVALEVYDVMGRKVTTLLEGVLGSGNYTVIWQGVGAEGESLASGVYMYRLTTDGHVQTRKMVLMR